MFKFFRNLLTGSILASLAFILLGIAFIAFPEGSMAIISNTIAVMLIVYGVYGLVLSFQSISVSYSLNIGTSIISLVLGIVILSNNAILEAIIPVILGVFFIINGVTKLRYAVVLKLQSRGWAGPVVVALVLVACGVIMLARPLYSAATLTTFLGIVMVVYAVCDLVDAIFLRKNIAFIEKYFKHGKDKIHEAEIVDKNKKK